LQKSVERVLAIDCYDEIILFDDCSTDKSYQIATELKNSYQNVTLYQHKKNTGKGSCVISVKQFVNTSHVIVHDADLEYDPRDIAKLYRESLKYPEDLILGSRTIGNIKRFKKYKGLVVVNKIFTSLFSFLNSYPVSDIASCYMLMPTPFLKECIYEENGFGIEVEILSKFLKTNNKIVELPINYSARSYSQGKKIKIKDGVNIFFKILKYRKLKNRNYIP
jgi:glycosyltransferase involved in cell wall biosynthesis